MEGFCNHTDSVLLELSNFINHYQEFIQNFEVSASMELSFTNLNHLLSASNSSVKDVKSRIVPYLDSSKYTSKLLKYKEIDCVKSTVRSSHNSLFYMRSLDTIIKAIRSFILNLEDLSLLCEISLQFWYNRLIFFLGDESPKIGGDFARYSSIRLSIICLKKSLLV